MTESDIIYEDGPYWVGQQGREFTVYRHAGTHAKADSAYPRTRDGLTCAIGRCLYLARGPQKGLGRQAQDVIARGLSGTVRYDLPKTIVTEE